MNGNASPLYVSPLDQDRTKKKGPSLNDLTPDNLLEIRLSVRASW